MTFSYDREEIIRKRLLWRDLSYWVGCEELKKGGDVVCAMTAIEVEKTLRCAKICLHVDLILQAFD